MVKFTTLAYQRCALQQLRFIVTSLLLLVFGGLHTPEIAVAKPAFSTIAIDARNGKVLYSRNADSYRYPASLTKVMTLYLMFEDLRDGKITLETRLKVSKRASKQAPSKLGLRPGRTIRVREAIGALVTKSANDAAVVVAENLSGSVEKFAQRMTNRARALGMTRTTFKNPHGLPNSRQRTTARDMATLALRIHRDFPQYYKYFKLRSYKYGKRNYRNHNRLLGRVSGVDGIKTGYTRASGFNLTTSTRRNGKRVVAVVMGGKTGRSRNAYMTNLINRMFKTKRLTKGKHLALVAGKPPGYSNPARKIASVKKQRPPLPRSRPEQDNVAIASIAHSAAVESLTQPTVKPEPASETVAKGSVYMTVTPPAPEPAPGDQDITALATQVADAEAIQAIDATEREAALKADATNTASITVVAKTEEKVVENERPAATEDLSTHTKTWNIQIGAFPTREGARSRLDTALKKAKRNLGNKSAFTMPVRSNGKTLFRARYSGFSKVSAKSTCKILSRRGVRCFALAPKG